MKTQLTNLLEFIAHNYRIHHALFFGYDLDSMRELSNNCFKLSSIFEYQNYEPLKDCIDPNTLDAPFTWTSVSELVEAIHVVEGYEIAYAADTPYADLLVSRAMEHQVYFIITEKDYGVPHNNYSKHLFGDLHLYSLDLIKCYKNGII